MGGEPFAEEGGVGGERGASRADTAERRGAELDLSAGLEGQPATGGELVAGLPGDADGDGALGIRGADRQPLDFDADAG